GRALDQALLLQPGHDSGRRGALHALQRREFARRERAVGVDRRERRGLARAEVGARLLAQPASGARDREPKPRGELAEVGLAGGGRAGWSVGGGGGVGRGGGRVVAV